MTFDDIIVRCVENPNGTFDLVPYLDPRARTVVFRWGNSLLLKLDPKAQAMAKIVDKLFYNLNEERIRSLMLLPNVRILAAPAIGEIDKIINAHEVEER